MWSLLEASRQISTQDIWQVGRAAQEFDRRRCSSRCLGRSAELQQLRRDEHAHVAQRPRGQPLLQRLLAILFVLSLSFSPGPVEIPKAGSTRS